MLFKIKDYLFILNLILISQMVLAEKSFSYKYQNFWRKNFSECGMHHQSPVELFCPSHKVHKSNYNIRYFNYRKSLSLPVKIKNNGHTIEVTPSKTIKATPFLTAKFLPGKRFELQSFHFHWGSKNNRGTEHTLNGHHHALEMHIVHKNVKYKTINEARTNTDGLLVLGVLYKASKTLKNYNFGLSYITWHLQNVKKFNSNYEINNRHFSMMNILGNLKRNNFFVYNGSLTTPPCNEAVTWVVYEDIQIISEYQLNLFRKIKDADGLDMSDNYRKVKPIADRYIYYYSDSVI